MNGTRHRWDARAPRRRVAGNVTNLLALLLATAPLAAAENICSDPYWSSTLRCVDAGNPDLVPEPAPEEPQTPAEIGQFTRVDLVGDETLRCLDGTRPILYVDPADDPESDDWVLTLAGSGTCSAVFDEYGDLVGGQDCLDAYRTRERGEMGTSDKPATKNLEPEGGRSGGINSPDAFLNPFFAKFHRVRIEACSHDRFNGVKTRLVEADHPDHAAVRYELFQHGQRIVTAALQALRAGVRYDVYEPDGQGGVQKFEAAGELPPLEMADQVLFIGHGSAAHGIIHTIDRFASELNGLEVRVVIDANFLPALENEIAFNDPPMGDIYDHMTRGESVAVDEYDESYFANPQSRYRATYRSWSDANGIRDVMDASCISQHRDDPWRCADRYHVLFNHITTPMFVREDFTDPSANHTANQTGHRVEWAKRSADNDCPEEEPVCVPRIDLGQFRERLVEQQEELYENGAVDSELAKGDDESGEMPIRFLWMPDCTSHPGAYSKDAFENTWMIDQAENSAVNLRTALQAFLEFPRTAPNEDGQRWVHDYRDVTSICPGEPGAPPPAVPDGRNSAPMVVDRVSLDGSHLRISWDASSCSPADHHLIVGGSTTWPDTLGGSYEVLQVVCDLGATSPYEWTSSTDPALDENGLIWWLVVADDDAAENGREGPWGTDSSWDPLAQVERNNERNGTAHTDACNIGSKSFLNTCGRE